MPRWLQILLHIATIGAGAFAAHSTGTSLPLLISGGVQAIVGGIGQIYNTDGTPQTTAYIPPPAPPK